MGWIPAEFAFGGRHRRQVLFEDVLADAQEVGAEVARPADAADVEVERLAVFGRQRLHQRLDFGVGEEPLARRVIVKDAHQPVRLLVVSHLRVPKSDSSSRF